MKRLVWFLCVAVLAWPGAVWAQSIPAPNVVKGKYVYTVPVGFDPPAIGKAGIQKIQKAAEKLHFPYYVVLVEHFDGESDDDAATVIDTLVEQWQKDPDFDSSVSSVFLLSYNPRKYRFLAGSRWEADLGFVREAHLPYTSIFTSYVQSARKDPQTGIIKMMQAVDGYYFTETDPKTIAQRKEAERKAEIARLEAEEKAQAEARLQQARDTLGREASAMNALLASDPRFLPQDVREYRSALNSAYLTISEQDTERIRGEAATLHIRVRELGQHVYARKAEARERQMQLAARAIGFGAGFLILLIAIVSRAKKLRRLKRSFAVESGSLEEKILNAHPRYLDFEQERSMIIGLKDLIGRTREVYESTTREVDAIFITIGALQNRIDFCKAAAARATFWNLRPLEKAIDDLQSEFTTDTGQISKTRLFVRQTRQVTLKPAEAMQELEHRFSKTIEQWNHLKTAAEIRFHQAEDVFPHTRLDDMFKAADANGIPHHWLADHPLFGDDESDSTLYERINEGRVNDPVSFLEKIDDLRRAEENISDRLARLIESVNMVKSQRIDSTPDLSMTVLQPQDDPGITFGAARREDARFTAMLASRDDVAELEEQAASVRNLYRKCIEQAMMAQAAVSLAGQEVETARNSLDEVSELVRSTEQMVADRQHIHINLNDAEVSLNNGRRFLQSGRQSLDEACALLAQRRHLDAENSASQAQRRFAEVRKECENCARACRELDEAKRQFEKKAALMDAYRQEYELRMRRYGGSSARLAQYNRARTDAAADYITLLQNLNKLESSWEDEVRRARRQYEEAERQRREAEELRRRNSSSFSSSSGGSSRSRSSSSSSGGSSSSSSRSSSSGGSW